MEGSIRMKETKEELASIKVNQLGQIISVNSVFCQLFSKAEDELHGLDVKDLMTRVHHKKKIFFSNVSGIPCLIQWFERSGHNQYVILLTQGKVHLDELKAFLNAEQNLKNTSSCYSFSNIIGESIALEKVKDLAARIATSTSTVLITGESGTGKELFAQAIHGLSSRKEQPFIAVNCAAIPDELFESEVFGYEEGAFSGAKKEGKPGKIELAQNGTLFLDEISELPLQAQGKLLRVLQEREIERLGGTGKRLVDIRIITATNKDLKALVKEGKFRQDLYYRLYVFDLKIPSLKERKEDILPLTYYFIEDFNMRLGRDVREIEHQLKSWLLSYDWPGNVRELKATIERGMNLVEGRALSYDAIHFTSFVSQAPDIHFSTQPFSCLEEAVQQAEITAINHALQKAGGDRTEAALNLKIHIASLYRKMAKYGIK
ncbi:sigma-54 interaction domain-containing protein [Cytobacillus purgationiresistens]|uniref:Transcriptional regulator with PAS, ATPase and Fis domain n=1 Tax=Cytobacillus purgationiresistens TaxID=863449 RepID=A0ABU0APX2_9BACI|nr:sigma 54-interacting transcriptional regulator [Cytobacillus purgationiresistens]MDQ0273248.1 transcriptional regulator with PAS, ATPase and Fis domain [Cytobacillus purgationiresistens]